MKVRDESAHWMLQMTPLSLERGQSPSIPGLAPDAGSDLSVISSLFVHQVSPSAEHGRNAATNLPH